MSNIKIVTSSVKPRKFSVLNSAKWQPPQSQNWPRHTSAVSYFALRQVGYESWCVSASLCGFVYPKMSTRELKTAHLPEKCSFFVFLRISIYIYIYDKNKNDSDVSTDEDGEYCKAASTSGTERPTASVNKVDSTSKAKSGRSRSSTANRRRRHASHQTAISTGKLPDV